jgi:hypothetical protein
MPEGSYNISNFSVRALGIIGRECLTRKYKLKSHCFYGNIHTHVNYKNVSAAIFEGYYKKVTVS